MIELMKIADIEDFKMIIDNKYSYAKVKTIFGCKRHVF